MTRDGLIYARFDVWFFFHDDRFTRLSLAHQKIYMGYWMLARELQREILTPGFDEYEVSRRVGVSKYCAKTFKFFLDKLKKFNPEPLLSFSPEGYVKVHSIRSKHTRLTNWHDAEDRELNEKFFPTSIGEDRRGEDRIAQDKKFAQELQDEMDRITPSKEPPTAVGGKRKPLSLPHRVMLECWEDNWREWRKGQDGGPEAYMWGQWDTKNLGDLLQHMKLDYALTAIFFYRMYYKQANMTVGQFTNRLAEITHTAKDWQWGNCQKLVREYRALNPELFQNE